MALDFVLETHKFTRKNLTLGRSVQKYKLEFHKWLPQFEIYSRRVMVLL